MMLTDGGLAVLEPVRDSWISPRVVATEDLTAADPRIRSIFCPLIPKGGLVVDAGAFIGDHTVAYAEAVGPEGEVLAFEPSPEAFACLLINTKPYPHVRVAPYALGAQRSRTGLGLFLENAGGTYLRPQRKREVTAEVIPLDAMTFARLDYLKIDVEGFEVQVLRGAQQSIRKHRPIMVIETGAQCTRYGDTEADLYELLHVWAYSVERLPPERPSDRLVYDILCRP